MPPIAFSLSSLMGSSSSREKAKSVPVLSPVPSLPVPTNSISRNGHIPSRSLPSIQPPQPPLLNVTHETPPELQPIFTFLSNHSRKLYTEGYFLKLTDLNADGKPHADRQWMECFAQLVGTVLSLWEAAALDKAGENDEVVPTFLNLTDSSIRMIDTLPTKSADTPTLRNVLSISTAGKNRYLFYFNSHHSLTQWTAGIRLALFELAMLQEAYTGALIGSKGKSINGINNLMQRTRFKYEDWARVRFAAGEPWNKYWAVITPPDEKPYQKWKKETKKGKQPREPLVLGNIKFYATKKTKKATPVATITKAYSCYAIYPQSEALIEHSTLVKVEGQITLQNLSEPREGFVFIMPDTHPSVSGFEMMIRWLFPTFDAFHLYGRPERLAAEVMDIKSLMFAMPREAKYGYLEVADVAHLMSTDKQRIVSEMDWRRKLKDLTLRKMQDIQKARNSLPAQSGMSTIVFNDNRSSSSSSPAIPYPPRHVPTSPSIPPIGKHNRSMSEAQGYMNYHDRIIVGYPPYERPSTVSAVQHHGSGFHTSSNDAGSEVHSDEDDGELFASLNHRSTRYPRLDLPEDIPSTPIMAHVPSSRPAHPLPPTPGDQSRMSIATLQTMVQGSVLVSAYQNSRNYRQNHDDTEHYDETLPRQSHESNMFEDLPIRRAEWTSSASLGSEPAAQWPSVSRSYTPSPHHPLPPPPSQETKISTERFSHSPPPPDPPRHLYFNPSDDFRPDSTGLASPQSDEQNRLSWEPASDKLGTSVDNRPPKLDLSHDSAIMVPLPSPPVPAKIPLKSGQAPQPPILKTNMSFNNLSTNHTPHSTDSLGSLANHMMNTEALNRVSQHMARVNSQEDMSELNRAAKMARASRDSDSGSEYGNDESDDYASSDEGPEVAKLPPRVEGARTGVMKTVGQRKASDVIIGDSHYRSVDLSLQDQDVETNIPKVDFGRTFNHGRSLSSGSILGQPSSQTRTVSKGNGQLTESVSGIHSEHASPAEYTKGETQQNMNSVLVGTGHNRIPSTGSSSVFDDTKRPHQLRQYSSPEPGDGRGIQGISHNKMPSTSRNIAWQPGLVQTGGNSKLALRSETPEKYVAEQAASAKQQSQARNRYVHSRRPSRNSSAEQIPRPPSRGGNSAFSPHGLISAPDLSSHLSAREQEYIARKTGTTLLQMEEGNIRKQIPHQAGLLGALEAREKEKKDMKDGWKSGKLVSNNVTVQQALVQRQLHARTVSPSSRGPSEAIGRTTSQQYPQPPQSPLPPAQPDSGPSQFQSSYGQYQQQKQGAYFGYGSQGGHGQYNGR